MVDLFDLFFGTGPSLKLIFELGFNPSDDDFLELIPEQYEKFYRECGKTDQKVYALLPKDPRQCAHVAADEVMAFTEDDRAFLKSAWSKIERYCSKADRTFRSDEEKMIYAASQLPEVFTKGTRFEIYHTAKMSVIECEGYERK